jgi:hypothetical protein
MKVLSGYRTGLFQMLQMQGCAINKFRKKTNQKLLPSSPRTESESQKYQYMPMPKLSQAERPPFNQKRLSSYHRLVCKKKKTLMFFSLFLLQDNARPLCIVQKNTCATIHDRSTNFHLDALFIRTSFSFCTVSLISGRSTCSASTS